MNGIGWVEQKRLNELSCQGNGCCNEKADNSQIVEGQKYKAKTFFTQSLPREIHVNEKRSKFHGSSKATKKIKNSMKYGFLTGFTG